MEEQDASMGVLGSDVESVASAAAGIGAGIDLVEAAAGDSERHAAEVDRVADGLHDSARTLRDSVGRFQV